MIRPLAIALLCLGAASTAMAESGQSVKLAATLFGETVGEVELSRTDGTISTIRYRSDLFVVRDQLRFRSKAWIEASFDPDSGKLVKSTARRCTEPEDKSSPPKCSDTVALAKREGVPSLAAEIVLSRQADGKKHCIDVIDEESGEAGKACADVRAQLEGIVLTGSKLDEPFRAVVRNGLLVELELPNHGARFIQTTGDIEVSDEDLFAGPVPSRGDPTPGIRQGVLRMELYGMPQALQLLKEVDSPGQTITPGENASSLRIEVRRQAMPKGKKARDILDRAALLVSKARDTHADCQAASNWFAAEAKARGWKTEPAVGLAYVDGRFAFHQWVIIRTPEGRVPIDPLLAQVPADAGHLQLSSQDGSAGDLLVQFRRGLSIAVE